MQTLDKLCSLFYHLGYKTIIMEFIQWLFSKSFAPFFKFAPNSLFIVCAFEAATAEISADPARSYSAPTCARPGSALIPPTLHRSPRACVFVPVANLPIARAN